MSSKCLVAEDASATKSELEEITQIMAGVSLKPEEEEKKKEPTPPARTATPPPETPVTVILETKNEVEEVNALDKTLLSEADPYFKTSDDETTTYI
mgnify:CR=1 FL=1